MLNADLPVAPVESEIRSVGTLVLDSGFSDVAGEFGLLDFLGEHRECHCQQNDGAKELFHFTRELSIKQI